MSYKIVVLQNEKPNMKIHWLGSNCEADFSLPRALKFWFSLATQAEAQAQESTQTLQLKKYERKHKIKTFSSLFQIRFTVCMDSCAPLMLVLRFCLCRTENQAHI